MDFDFTPKYIGPAAQKDKVVNLFFKQLELMGRNQDEMNCLGLVPQELERFIDDVVIRAEDGKYVAEFQTTPNEDYFSIEKGFTLPNVDRTHRIDERDLVPPGFCVYSPENELDPRTPEGLIRNIWEYMRNREIGQQAMGEYLVGQVKLTRINTGNMERLTTSQKKQLIPRANGSFGYRARKTKLSFVTVPFDDERRSMAEMWKLCEPTSDMSAGEMAQRIAEVIQTGMLSQRVEYELNPNVGVECDVLTQYSDAVKRVASNSTTDGITNWGKVTFYGIPRHIFCTAGKNEVENSMFKFRPSIQNGETDFKHTEETVTVDPVYASMHINPRMVRGKLLL
jgi:hypothetical protein